MKTKVAIIEDNIDLKEAYSHFISKTDNFKVICSFDNVEDLITLIKNTPQETPDILL